MGSSIAVLSLVVERYDVHRYYAKRFCYKSEIIENLQTGWNWLRRAPPSLRFATVTNPISSVEEGATIGLIAARIGDRPNG